MPVKHGACRIYENVVGLLPSTQYVLMIDFRANGTAHSIGVVGCAYARLEASAS